MNYLLRFLPFLFNRDNKVRGKKRWVGIVLVLVSGYQAFSPNGIGAQWGIPSFDTFYKESRDVLITRVEAASDAQKDTAEEFRSALDEFKLVTGFEGGDLEKQYAKLNVAYERSEKAAENVSSRIDRVVMASNRLLSEWKDELQQYHDVSIKRKAESQFDVTRKQTEKMIAVMRNAESKTAPVLGVFRDQVLFLKHNLNVQAISSLKQNSVAIEQDVAALIEDMEVSIAEAESFIQQLSL